MNRPVHKGQAPTPLGGFIVCRRGDQGNKESSDSCRAVPRMETQGPAVLGHCVRKTGSRAACMCPLTLGPL